MSERVAINNWSIKPCTGWESYVRKDDSYPGTTDYLELESPGIDATLRLTPDDRNLLDAADWVDLVAKINRNKNRQVSIVHHGRLKGNMVEFTASDEWIRGWALMIDQYPLDVCYRCNISLAGRDDGIVQQMLDSIRLESEHLLPEDK